MSRSRRRRRRSAAPACLVAGGLVLTACTSAQPVAVPTFSVVPAPTVTSTPAPCTGIPLRARAAPGGLPDTTLQCLGSAAKISLARLRGPALVNVWGSWCGPCVGELPVLGRFATANPSITVVGVDIGDSEAAPAIDELSVAGVRYPNLVDFPGVIRAAGAPTVPTTLFVGASGKIVFRHVGAFGDTSSVRADVRRYLGIAAG